MKLNPHRYFKAPIIVIIMFAFIQTGLAADCTCRQSGITFINTTPTPIKINIRYGVITLYAYRVQPSSEMTTPLIKELFLSCSNGQNNSGLNLFARCEAAQTACHKYYDSGKSETEVDLLDSKCRYKFVVWETTNHGVVTHELKVFRE